MNNQLYSDEYLDEPSNGVKGLAQTFQTLPTCPWATAKNGLG